MERTILHCDMNNFFASVECTLDKSLRGHPVAVGGEQENRHGIILAKNYEAKAYGVQTGEALWQAREKCPELIIVHPHYEQYLKYSQLARRIYADYTGFVEPYGMDECWLDVTGCTRKYGSGEALAHEIRNRIKSELGVTVSVGVSFNKIFAKLGSDMKKPDAVTVIPKETFRDRIWHLPASDLLGVGRATERALNAYGIHTIGELAQAPGDLIKKRLGKCGLMCIAYANGLDCSPVAPVDFDAPVKSVGHGVTTREDLESPGDVKCVILSLSQTIGAKLRLYEKRAGSIQICIRNNQLGISQWQCPLNTRTNSENAIASAAFSLFSRTYDWRYPIRSVTVRAIDLHPEYEPEQLDIYGDSARVEKRERLEYAADEIRRRFGRYAIVPASLCGKTKLPTDREIELRMPTGMVS